MLGRRIKFSLKQIPRSVPTFQINCNYDLMTSGPQTQFSWWSDPPESVWFIEKADHGEEDGPDVLGGVPPLAGQLAALRVVHGGMQDGYAQVSVLKQGDWYPINYKSAAKRLKTFHL